MNLTRDELIRRQKMLLDYNDIAQLNREYDEQEQQQFDEADHPDPEIADG